MILNCSQNCLAGRRGAPACRQRPGRIRPWSSSGSGLRCCSRQRRINWKSAIETHWFRPVGASRQRPTNRRAAGGTPCHYSRDRGGGFTELPEDTEGVSFVTVICRYTEAFILMTENGSLPVSHVTVLAGTPVALTL